MSDYRAKGVFGMSVNPRCKRYLAVFSVLPILVVGCGTQTEPVYLKNSSTGEVVQCGPYGNDPSIYGTNVPQAVAMREAQCIRDYKEQGFVRVPTPN